MLTPGYTVGGRSFAAFVDGFATFTALQVFGPPDNITLTFVGTTPATRPVVFTALTFCPAGQSYDVIERSCRDCTPGSFAPVANSLCEPCRPGNWSAEAGSKHCEMCPRGTVQSLAGSLQLIAHHM